MRLHRFYIDPEAIALTHEFWVHDQGLLNQWLRVLRYREGSELILFDGVSEDRLYRITRNEPDGVKLEMITQLERKLPEKHMYLFFSLLKKDKNEWVLQKCTELGVRNFVPVIAERSEKTGFNLDRAKKIIIEAAEQCGRSDIPHVREPLQLDTALAEYKGKVHLLVADESLSGIKYQISNIEDALGVFIGPEGGWTDEELNQFKSAGFGSLHLGKLTLRAETAAVAAITKLL